MTALHQYARFALVLIIFSENQFYPMPLTHTHGCFTVSYQSNKVYNKQYIVKHTF